MMKYETGCDDAARSVCDLRLGLFELYRDAANRGRHFRADLWAAELKNDAIAGMQLDCAGTRRNGTTRPAACE
jgi:hypothetical protein